MSDSLVVDSRADLTRGTWMAWLVCLSAGLFFLYEFFQLNLFDVINQPLRLAFQVDATGLSWMSSAFLWGDILFLLPAGMMLDKFSTRWVILWSLLVCILGTFGFALTHSFAWATFFHLLSGIGNAFCFLACVVLVTRWFPSRRQALVIGCLVTMAFLGGMLAHTPLAFLNDKYGWRNALLMDAGVGVLIFFWIMLFVKDRPPEEHRPDSHHETSSSAFLMPLKNPQNWLAGLYTACLNLPIMVLCALWGASYLQVVHQISPIVSSNIVSLIFMGSIVGCPLAGWLSDRAGRRKPIMIAGVLATFVTLIPLCLDTVLSESMLAVLFFGLGFFTSTQVISYPLIAESNSANNTGSATGMASIIIMGGGGVGQILFGGLMQRHAGLVTETYTVADYHFAMWMFPMAVMVAGLAMVFTRETSCRRLERERVNVGR